MFLFLKETILNGVAKHAVKKDKWKNTREVEIDQLKSLTEREGMEYAA